MTKCNCSGSTCGCKARGSGDVSVTGTGTAQDPYIIGLEGLDISATFEVDDTTTVDLTLLGSGTNLDPFVLSAAVHTGTVVTTVPTDAGTTVIGTDEGQHLLDHSSTIAAHTVTLPSSSTALLKEVLIIANAEITDLTVDGDTGTTVQGAPTTLAANESFRMRLVGTVWRRA